MPVEIVACVVVLGGGFLAARAFQFRRMNKAGDARRERDELRRRRHHFQGYLDVELVKEPSRVPPEIPAIDDPEG